MTTTAPLTFKDFKRSYAATKDETEEKVAMKHHLSDIYKLYLADYLADPKRKLFIQSKHLRAVNQSIGCREHGCHKFACGECGDMVEVKFSCRHRFCARCGAAASNKWAEKLRLKLLNILHGHLVFTLPFYLRSLSIRNERVFYEALFTLSAQAIRAVLRETYGIEVGIVVVLHTYGSDLKYHPHVHVIVSCGGIRRNCVQALKGDYLCDHKVLAARFESLFKAHLCDLYAKGELNTEGVLAQGEEMTAYIDSQDKQPWIVGMNMGIQDTAHLIGYCGRYLRRACLSEYRIISIDKGMITFSFKDYKKTPRGEKPIISIKTMTATAFLDALLQHVPDKGFVGVRYYGIYANASKALEKCAYSAGQLAPLLGKGAAEESHPSESSDLETFRATQSSDFLVCSCCGIERQLVSSSMKGVVFKSFAPINDS
jgi:Putative transposase/Transposase zinc-binding domain